MTAASVVLVSRGDDMSVALASLIAQDGPFPLHCVLGQLPNERDGHLLDTLRRMGWPVTMNLVRSPGVGQARYEAAEHAHGTVLISLDDDAVLKPSTALEQLADAALDHPFATPIIRFVHNFSGTLPDHQEIWEVVSAEHPGVRRSLARYGPDWRRVFDFGIDMPTSRLGGTAFAVRRERYIDAVRGLQGWTAGGEDAYLGAKLCASRPGIALSGVYAYHVGTFDPTEWGFDQIGMRLAHENPDEFRKYAT